MKKQTKTSSIVQIVSFLKRLSLTQLKEIVKNFKEFRTLVIYFAKPTKEKVSLQCLKDNAEAWGWNKERRDRIGINMEVVTTPKDVWSKPDRELLDIDQSKFGQATITTEEPPFNLEDIGTSYKVLTEKDLFPDQTFVEMNILQAIRKFIGLVDKLNRQSMGKTGKPRYYVPGLETQQFFHENENEVPGFMKDGKWYHYPAASFRHHNGRLYVPCSHQDGSSFRRNGCWLNNGWNSINRFLVLEIILRP